MSRQNVLLAVLGFVLIVVLFYMFLFRPGQQEVADLQEQTRSTEEQQQQVRAQIQALEAIRAEAPEIEAAVAAARSVVPADPALPAAVRQLQVAADSAGVTLLNIGVSRPAEVEATASGDATVPAGLAQIQVSLSLSGGYYQVVDFLRRIEDPVLTPRALLWSDLAVTQSDYPTLQVTANGSMFAILPAADLPEEGDTESDDVDVDVDVDVTETDGDEAATATATEAEVS